MSALPLREVEVVWVVVVLLLLLWGNARNVRADFLESTRSQPKQ